MALEQSLKKVYVRATTKSILLLLPEYRLCRQNETEHGQVLDQYPNVKGVCTFYLDGRLYSSERILLFLSRTRIKTARTIVKSRCLE